MFIHSWQIPQARLGGGSGGRVASAQSRLGAKKLTQKYSTMRRSGGSATLRGGKRMIFDVLTALSGEVLSSFLIPSPFAKRSHIPLLPVGVSKVAAARAAAARTPAAARGRGRGGAGRGGAAAAAARVGSATTTRGGGAAGRGGAKGAGRGGANKKPAKPDKDSLDDELEKYMSQSKGYLDSQLDSYMAQKGDAAKAEAAT